MKGQGFPQEAPVSQIQPEAAGRQWQDKRICIFRGDMQPSSPRLGRGYTIESPLRAAVPHGTLAGQRL